MSSWKANWSRWSVTISRVAVIGSPVVVRWRRLGRRGRGSLGLVLIPSQIIGINGRSVNEPVVPGTPTLARDPRLVVRVPS